MHTVEDLSLSIKAGVVIFYYQTIPNDLLTSEFCAEDILGSSDTDLIFNTGMSLRFDFLIRNQRFNQLSIHLTSCVLYHLSHRMLPVVVL